MGRAESGAGSGSEPWLLVSVVLLGLNTAAVVGAQ